jgi:hypothetical protein
MRSLTKSERRLILILGAIAFLVLNFWGYNELVTRRTIALGQQRSARGEIFRLKQLQLEKVNAELNREWIAARLPAYKDVDQFYTYLYRIVQAEAHELSIELTKAEPRQTQRDQFVHRSIVVVEFTDEIESLIKFLHGIQDREAFRFISHCELVAGKDPQNVRCQATIEQWWRSDSEELAGLIPAESSTAPANSPAPETLPSQPASGEAPASRPASGRAASNEPAAGKPDSNAPGVEQSTTETVKTAASQSPAASPAKVMAPPADQP